MPTAVQIEELVEHMLDKFYPAVKPLLPVFRKVLDFTKPLWNVMMAIVMSKIIELSQEIKDYLTPSDYKQVWTTEKTNLVLLRLIHLWAFALRGAESMLSLYINVIFKAVFKVVGFAVCKLIG